MRPPCSHTFIIYFYQWSGPRLFVCHIVTSDLELQSHNNGLGPQCFYIIFDTIVSYDTVVTLLTSSLYCVKNTFKISVQTEESAFMYVLTKAFYLLDLTGMKRSRVKTVTNIGYYIIFLTRVFVLRAPDCTVDTSAFFATTVATFRA